MESLFSKKLTPPAQGGATQQFLDVAEIKEDTIILKNGTLRAVLAVSAINYDLKSTSEQEAIILFYQNFLNSLDFPLQILITSRKINMGKYLDFLETKGKTQRNELLKFQIAEYQNFITQLVSVSSIMDKNFYIIIPFAPIENTEKGFLTNLVSSLNPRKNVIEKRENFETYRNQLALRIEHITSGLSGIGLKISTLKTQELVELVFNAYNPNILTPTEIGDVAGLDLNSVNQ